MRQLLSFAERFRMDNPLVKFGADVYQPGLPINLTYDAFGPPAAFLRGLFEYLYQADQITLVPHIPPTIARLEQRFPVRFGSKRLYLATVGKGPITQVIVNGKEWESFDSTTAVLQYDQLPETSVIEFVFGDAQPLGFQAPPLSSQAPTVPSNDAIWLALGKPNLVPNDFPLRIGADSKGQCRFQGDIARVRLFNRALSVEEIAMLRRGANRSVPGDLAPVADWQFSQTEDGDFVSQVGEHLRARVVGQADIVEDKMMGQAVHLDGSCYLEVVDCSALDFTEACTLEAWIRPQGLPPGGARIIDKSEVGTSNGYLLDTYPADSLRLISQAGTISHAATLPIGEWMHVVGTVSSDGERALYLQGSQVAHESGSSMPDIPSLLRTAERLKRFHRLLTSNQLGKTYEAAHTRLAVDCVRTAHQRLMKLGQQKLTPLENPVSQSAADQSYVDTASQLAEGLVRVLGTYQTSTNPERQRILRLWEESDREHE
jgi:hypothetical protein